MYVNIVLIFDRSITRLVHEYTYVRRESETEILYRKEQLMAVIRLEFSATTAAADVFFIKFARQSRRKKKILITIINNRRRHRHRRR